MYTKLISFNEFEIVTQQNINQHWSCRQRVIMCTFCERSGIKWSHPIWNCSQNLAFARIALFTVIFFHLHYNTIQHVCEAISGYFAVLARNCLASTLDYIVMQMRKINREKGYCSENLDDCSLPRARKNFCNCSHARIFVKIPCRVA